MKKKIIDLFCGCGGLRFVISIVIANVVGSRTITTGIHLGPITLSTSGGAITYAVTAYNPIRVPRENMQAFV